MKRFSVLFAVIVLIVGLLSVCVAEDNYKSPDEVYIPLIKTLSDSYHAAPDNFSDAKVIAAYDLYRLSIHARDLESAIKIIDLEQYPYFDPSSLPATKLIANANYKMSSLIDEVYEQWLDDKISNSDCAKQMFEWLDSYISIAEK